MNAKKFSKVFVLLVCLAPSWSFAATAGSLVRQGNKLYTGGDYNGSIEKYDQALVETPDAAEPKFDKANSFYRLDDIEKASGLYRDVEASSRDMGLVAMAQYNLGNCFFKQGTKQKDSDLQKAVDSLKTAIEYWRKALDIDPKNEKAAKNVEVARLTIKDLIDQINKQRDPNQPQDPNQQGQEGQQQQDPNEQGKQGPKQEPNQPGEPNESKAQQQQDRQAVAPDATAQEILDKEQRQRQERQMLQGGGYQKVDKDW